MSIRRNVRLHTGGDGLSVGHKLGTGRGGGSVREPNMSLEAAGLQWRGRTQPFEVFGVVQAPKCRGQAWLVVDGHAMVPDSNLHSVDLKKEFLTAQPVDLLRQGWVS